MGDSVIGGRYRLRQPLGGTMSEVYGAEDLELERPVVVKLLGLDADRARFEREARAAAALAHENIVRIYEYGNAADGRPFMVLEHLPGGSLEDRLRGGRLDDDETWRVARDVAAGLAHAHARGLVHRDLKPANVLFDEEGRAKIADFGIARVGGAGTLTEAGTVLGTAAYISPEQGAGDAATPASDVYSFGVMLFRMLTGTLPFASERPLELVRLHQTQPAPSLSDVRPDVPRRLDSLVAATLAKDPRDRPRDGAALVAELADAAGEPTTRLAAAPARESRRRRLPRALLAVPFALLAVAGIAAAVVATRDGSHSAPLITTAAPTTVPKPAPAPATAAEEPETEAPESETETEATTRRVATRVPSTAPPPETEPPATAILTEPTETLPTIATTIPIPAPDG